MMADLSRLWDESFVMLRLRSRALQSVLISLDQHIVDLPIRNSETIITTETELAAAANSIDQEFFWRP